MNEPRLRMFAGPNGSGKSTIKKVLPPELLGVYLIKRSCATSHWSLVSTLSLRISCVRIGI